MSLPDPGQTDEPSDPPMPAAPMPTASDDPSSPYAAEPPDNGASDQVELRRVMRRYRRGDVEVDEIQEDEDEVLVLSLKLRPPGGRRRPVEPDEAESRSKVNRFTSRTTGAASTPTRPPAPVVDVEASAPPPGAPLMKLTPRTSQGAVGKGQWQRRTLFSRALPFLVLAVAVGALAYLAGRRISGMATARLSYDGEQTLALPPKTAVWSSTTIAQLDAVLTADAKGDLKTARQLATDLKRKVPDAPGLTLYLSTLDVRQGSFNDAENGISKMLTVFTPPLQAAAVNEHLGFIYARHRDLPRAVSAFADAAAADPFSFRHFCNWAEALRRSGQLHEALVHFRQALTRLPPGQPGTNAQRDEIEFKMRLTQIEAGKDDEVKSALDARLAKPAPGGLWLLTAAAYALQRNDYPGAADALQKARAVMLPEDYAVLTNDYFFHAYSDHKELASLLPEDSPAVRAQPFEGQMGYFIDP